MEVVPLPRDRISERLPVHIEIGGLEAWPNNRFRMELDWNNAYGKWIMVMRHLGTNDVVVHAPVCLMREYAYQNYVAFIFHDPANEAEEVTPENLGRTVKLGVFPLEDA